uniref:Uncharacterized protein n=1 Tax=viral metagenome TaxID=1070528 RepID=A0A6C0LMC2_9ZZZZ
MILDRVDGTNYLLVYSKMGSNRNQNQNKNKNKTAKKPRALCQCYDDQGAPCKCKALENSPFCIHHQNCRGSPLSGSEPVRDLELYNKPAVRRCHNCYSYAMHVYDPKGVELCKKYGNCRNFFHQPGAKTGHRNELNKEERRSCPIVERLMMGDIPEVTKTTYDAKCPAGMSKVAAVVDKGVDYHWYRQDRDGYWSHKDGSNKVKTFDALKRPIFNPELASRDYRWQGSDLNYEDFCGFYCVPRDHPVVLGRGVNVPKSRKKARGVKKEGRVARKRGGHSESASPILPQTGSAQGGRGLAVGGGYDIRLNSLPGCPPWGPTVPPRGGRKTRKQRGQGYDIRLNSLPSCPPQGGMGLSWSDYPLHSTDDLRKRYSLGTKTLKRRQN